jgi:hypothetical protein
MIEEIRASALRCGLTRLCHFTSSRNLVHIVTGSTGLLATSKLREEERAMFTPTDRERLDHHESHICCSIQYPNGWYFEKSRAKDLIFRDWVVLLIRPEYLWQEGTKFCPRNAAARFGRGIGEGVDAFERLYEPEVVGAGGRSFPRGPAHLPPCPTDDQAEVLVPDQIDLDDILGIAVASDEHASREYVRMELLNVSPDQFPLVVAPAFYRKRILSNMIRSGQRPEETLWKP